MPRRILAEVDGPGPPLSSSSSGRTWLVLWRILTEMGGPRPRLSSPSSTLVVSLLRITRSMTRVKRRSPPDLLREEDRFRLEEWRGRSEEWRGRLEERRGTSSDSRRLEDVRFPLRRNFPWRTATEYSMCRGHSLLWQANSRSCLSRQLSRQPSKAHSLQVILPMVSFLCVGC